MAVVNGRVERAGIIDDVIRHLPLASGLDRARLVVAVESLQACAWATDACADACLQEEAVAELRTCIRLDLDTAAVCRAALQVLARSGLVDPSLLQSLVQTCVAFCRVTAAACAEHAERFDHCRTCARACLRCEEACLALLESMEHRASGGRHH